MDIEKVFKQAHIERFLSTLNRPEFDKPRDWRVWRYAVRTINGHYVRKEGFIAGEDGWRLKTFEMRLESLPDAFVGWHKASEDGWVVVNNRGVNPTPEGVATYWEFESFELQAICQIVAEWGVAETGCKDAG